MNKVQEFQARLSTIAHEAFATWHKVDLHNHSPASFDYRGRSDTASRDAASQLRANNISIAMFTDHSGLPSPAFTAEVARESGSLIIPGAELNVFADAFGRPKDKIDRQAYFHLLVGFDPDHDYPPEYWINLVFQKCGREERQIGGAKVVGIPNEIDRVLDELAGSNALLIPAHLHAGGDSFRSRSIDDIYTDTRFLSFVPRFTALEVTDLRTAEYFDGNHIETNHLEKTCIRSSDAHEPAELGRRSSWVLMQKRTFKDLKAGLELRSRVSLEQPKSPDCYVLGLHIQGNYLRDFWLPLSRHCNVFIGVKGSGKTAALECLRFALGVEVPKNNREQVKAQLLHILGAAGSVRCLVSRKDGIEVLVERRMSDPDVFELHFADGRVERLTKPHALGFPAQILGWHEIEHAATDSGIRRKYLNEIAGPEDVAALDDRARVNAERIRYVHEHAATKYQGFRTLHDQVALKEELRRGLQELKDGRLIELRDEYDSSISQRDETQRLVASLEDARQTLNDRTRSILPFSSPVLPANCALEAQVGPLRRELESLLDHVNRFRVSFESTLEGMTSTLAPLVEAVNSAFSQFAGNYETAVAQLTPEQRRLLDSHRQVLEQTRDLPSLQAQRDQIREELKHQLSELAALCSQVTEALEARSSLRRQKLAEFSSELAGTGLRLELLGLRNTETHTDLIARYREGFAVLQDIQNTHATETTLHRRLRRAYERLLDDLVSGYRLFFSNPEFSHYLMLFEDDDLAISFNPDLSNPNAEYRPIDQLSAGQRCTAMFPLLLKLRNGPLVIDQPEDNLDNRHIASKICPVVAADKLQRQMIMTSHNANLLVLSDPENVVVFEGFGDQGAIVSQGFLATRDSAVTKHVLDILDGGERALELRYAKYGAKFRT